jgi:hypothetical protein
LSERRIGFDDDTDEAQQVGSGCAELTPVEDTAGNMQRAARFVLRMRKAGATYVKLGDVEVSFLEAKSSE